MDLKSLVLAGTVLTGSLFPNYSFGEERNVGIFLNKELYPSIGQDNAKEIVVEMADFQCGFCAMASGLPSWVENYRSDERYKGTVDIAKKFREMADRGEIRFIYAPMVFFGEESLSAAEAGYCANEQGKFWEMHDAIYSAHEGKDKGKRAYLPENLKILARSIKGINSADFNSCLDSHRGKAKLIKVDEEATPFMNGGVPTFFGEKNPLAN